jgi:ribosome-binding protein aMBF1 (putative translation factor)
MTKARTDYQAFEQSSVTNRRLLREEELILDVTEALSEMLEEEGVIQTMLAQRLGKTKGFVSQILAGGRNLTLRTIADIADALGYRVRVVFSKETKGKQKTSTFARMNLPPVVLPLLRMGSGIPQAKQEKAQARARD